MSVVVSVMSIIASVTSTFASVTSIITSIFVVANVTSLVLSLVSMWVMTSWCPSMRGIQVTDGDSLPRSFLRRQVTGTPRERNPHPPPPQVPVVDERTEVEAAASRHRGNVHR